jgi:short-subunit dehydrogenase
MWHYLWTSIAGVIAVNVAALVSSIVTFLDVVLFFVFGRPTAAEPHVIVITGATSGLGESLALAYSKPGVTLALTGRNADRLRAVAGACEDRGAVVVPKVLDVMDERGMAEWLTELDESHPVDLMIANAGVSEATAGCRNDPERAAQIVFPINMTGALNSVLPLLGPMRARKRGQIALMSSLAGFGPLTGSSSYSASKTALRIWGEALRTEIFCDGVRVNVVCPGFVDSPMTRVNTFSMPWLMDSDAAMDYIIQGLANDLPIIAFPPQTFGLSFMASCLTPVAKDALARWGVLPGVYFYRKPKSSIASASGGAKAD